MSSWTGGERTKGSRSRLLEGRIPTSDGVGYRSRRRARFVRRRLRPFSLLAPYDCLQKTLALEPMKRGHAEHHAGGAGVRALTAWAQAGPGATGPEPWYVAEGKRGQQLLDHGQVGPATAVFDAILARLGAEPSYARAVIL